MRDLIASGKLGTIYSCRMFYGNGTARLVRDSAWRDHGAGVLPDLGSHLLDTCRFWFGDIADDFAVISARAFENRAPDHVVISSERGRTRIELEMTLLMWRNHFTCDILAEKGTAHIASLCKWGPTTFTRRTRVLPSGRPPEESVTLVEDDPTWALEYAAFQVALPRAAAPTDLCEDIWLLRALDRIGKDAAADGGEELVSAPTVGFAGMTHLGLVSASAVGRQRAVRSSATIPTPRSSTRLARRRAAGERARPRRTGPRQRRSARSFTAELSAIGRCDVVYIAPDVPTDDDGQSDLSGIRQADRHGRAGARPAGGAGRALPGAAGLHPQPCGAAAAPAVLPGRDAGFRPRGRTRDASRSASSSAAPIRHSRSIRACATSWKAFDCPILPMRYESAELAKISINMCLVASVSVANTLAELCEGDRRRSGRRSCRRSGSTAASGRYSYLAPGLGIAGGNLERDLATVRAACCRARQRCGHRRAPGAPTAAIAATGLRARSARRCSMPSPTPPSPCWGLAYKENTHSVKNSPSLATIAQLPKARLRSTIRSCRRAPRGTPRRRAFATPLEAAQGADALMILTPWPQYRAISARDIAGSLRGRIVLDPYGVLDADAAMAAGLRYYTLGRPAAGRGCGDANDCTSPSQRHRDLARAHGGHRQPPGLSAPR